MLCSGTASAAYTNSGSCRWPRGLFPRRPAGRQKSLEGASEETGHAKGMTVQHLLISADCFPAFGTARRPQGRRRHRICCNQDLDKATAKQNLRLAIAPTQRGGSASLQQRGVILEAQIGVEGLSDTLDYDLLPGLWKLIYTSAPDVAPLTISNGFSNLLPARIGDIYQEFSSVALGQVKNIITFRVPGLLESGSIEVRASYTVRSPRRIRLEFREAGVRDLRITDQVEALLAPALLPRNWISHRALLALREAEVSVPLRAGLPSVLNRASSDLERTFGSEYLLTFLDEDTLIGSQTGTGGTFVFERASCSVARMS